MTTPKQPRWTDLDRYQSGYATSKQSEEPGYLAARFAAIREQQAKDEAERATKVKAMRGRK